MNDRIRIARTDDLSQVTNSQNLNLILADGQPFYDANTKLVYIGNGVDTIADIKADATKAISASNVVNTINNVKISNIFESNGMTAKNASNVVSTINNVNISDIFEADGITVKNATDSTNAYRGVYCSDGTFGQLNCMSDGRLVLDRTDAFIEQKQLIHYGQLNTESTDQSLQISIPNNITMQDGDILEIDLAFMPSMSITPTHYVRVTCLLKLPSSTYSGVKFFGEITYPIQVATTSLDPNTGSFRVEPSVVHQDIIIENGVITFRSPYFPNPEDNFNYNYMKFSVLRITKVIGAAQ